MNLPSFLDISKIAQIGALVLVVVQYIKKPIPDKYIPYVSIAIGILISLLFEYRGAKFDIVNGIVNGVLGAIGADTSYGLLSNSKSPTFTLPSRAQLK
jgi:hypothetical protein